MFFIDITENVTYLESEALSVKSSFQLKVEEWDQKQQISKQPEECGCRRTDQKVTTETRI